MLAKNINFHFNYIVLEIFEKPSSLIKLITIVIINVHLWQITLISPEHGWIEINPSELWETFLKVFKEGLKGLLFFP